MGVRVSRRLCRDPHVPPRADAELDPGLAVVADVDPFCQPYNDHVPGFRVGPVEGLSPGELAAASWAAR